MIYSRHIFSGLSARRHFSGRSRWRQRGTPSGNRDPNIDGRYWEQIFPRRGHDLCGFWPFPEKYGRFSSGNKRSRTSDNQCTQLGWPPNFVACGCSFPRNGGWLSISPSRLREFTPNAVPQLFHTLRKRFRKFPPKTFRMSSSE